MNKYFKILYNTSGLALLLLAFIFSMGLNSGNIEVADRLFYEVITTLTQLSVAIFGLLLITQAAKLPKNNRR